MILIKNYYLIVQFQLSNPKSLDVDSIELIFFMSYYYENQVSIYEYELFFNN